jgi:hypothetical protein
MRVVVVGDHAQGWLDKVDEALFLQSRDGQYRVDFSGRFDLEGYYIDQRPPGLLLATRWETSHGARGCFGPMVRAWSMRIIG